MLLQLKQIYDHYRTVLFNQKYYAHRLTTVKRWNLSLEILLAIGTSAAIGTWVIWDTGIGEKFWPLIAGASAVLAILKPILQLPKLIERYSKLYIGHSELFYELKDLVSNIAVSQNLTNDTWEAFQLGKPRYRKLALEDDPKPIKKLRKRYFEEVKNEIPADKLWMPANK